jgi:hypothetical protein
LNLVRLTRIRPNLITLRDYDKIDDKIKELMTRKLQERFGCCNSETDDAPIGADSQFEQLRRLCGGYGFRPRSTPRRAVATTDRHRDRYAPELRDSEWT